MSSSALAIFLRMEELFSMMKSARPSSVRGVMAAAGLPLRVIITGSPDTTLLRSSLVLFLSSTVFAIFMTCVPPYSHYNGYMTGSQPCILPQNQRACPAPLFNTNAPDDTHIRVKH